MKKIAKNIAMILIVTAYLAATIFNVKFFTYLFSPLIMVGIFISVYKVFYLKQTNSAIRIGGLFLSLSILSWLVVDIIWWSAKYILNLDQKALHYITFGYSITNLLLTLALSIYGFIIFRTWNMVQVLLDAAILGYFVIDLIWLVFLEEDVKNIMELRSDWCSVTSVILDIILFLWIAIWYLSARKGKIPPYMRLLSSGIFFYIITDLIYYYELFIKDQGPYNILTAMYVGSFLLMAAAAVYYEKGKDKGISLALHNTGRDTRGYYLLAAPAIVIIFKGFDINLLLNFITAILLYHLMTTFIQKNILKESLLLKEQETNIELERKVKERTEELSERNKELQILINQDIITGLYNRRYLLTYLGKAIDTLEEGQTILLLYIDINRFKMISTMFGHYVCERILANMAKRLKPLEQKAKNTILASYGEDTYIFAAIGDYDYGHGYAFAQEAIRLGSDIYQIDDYQIRITVNIGISIFPYDALTKEELIKHADIAMNQARKQGFNVVCEYDYKLIEALYRRNSIEILLKRVNFKQEFMIYYQPEFACKNLKIIGFEALLRWKTSEGEWIGPSEFIPVAEETGYIIPIGDWVMRTALRQLLDWNTLFDDKITMGINVSLKQLNNMHFTRRLREEMEALHIRPEWIDIEITESIELLENQEVLQTLEEIRKLGVSISIDDFGTGFSSLSYFKSLPADRIKLARELIEYIHVDEFDYQLVKSIIMLAKAKGIRVIAEGVEKKEQWEVLKELQCDEVQGFYFGRPVPVWEAVMFLKPY